MRQRTAHHKSRKGCGNCKRRHVKCDEQGPPCANCTVRNLQNTCVFPDSSPSAIQRYGFQSAFSIEEPPPAPSPDRLVMEVSPGPENRRLLELQLMNRWSSSTYKTFCTPDLGQNWLQVTVPESALKYEFLLDGIFAISSMEMVRRTPDDENQSAMYFHAAMEYYNKSSTSFRRQLGNITRDNLGSMYITSFIVAALHMAMPQYSQEKHGTHLEGFLERTAMNMYLLSACSSIAVENHNWITDAASPSYELVTGAVTAMNDAISSLGSLDDSTKTAFSQLTKLIQTYASVLVNDEVSSRISTRSTSYQNATTYLRICFAADTKYDPGLGFCLGWPSMAGKDFNQAFRDAEPIAMLIVMYWAVLLDRFGSRVWWAVAVGRNLVLELSAMVLQLDSSIIILPETARCIAWAKQQVELTELKAD